MRTIYAAPTHDGPSAMKANGPSVQPVTRNQLQVAA